MKKSMKKILLLIVSALFISTSCTKWLDVTSETDIIESDLFSSSDGFRQAVNGLYTLLGTTPLYGRELTWGFSTVATEIYNGADLTTSNMLIYVIYHDFAVDGVFDNDDMSANVYDPMWAAAYKVIANTNNLLGYALEAEESMFEFGKHERDIIIGECYAIRALMHFEMLRFFGGALHEESATEARIPYVDDFYTLVPQYYDTKGILSLITKDLLEAREYLREYDTKVVHTFSGSDQFDEDLDLDEYDEVNTAFMAYRGSRMNYLATTLLLARAYLYGQDFDNAYKYASEVYSYSSFGELDVMNNSSFTSSDHTYSCKMSNEVLFSAVNYDMYDDYRSVVPEGKFLRINNPQQYFGTDTDDLRYTELFQEGSDATTRWVTEGDMEMLMPVIRVSESYYIMAECMLTPSCAHYNRDLAIDLMYNFRFYARGVNSNLETQAENLLDSEVIDLIHQDIIRESMDDGYVYWLYKRLGTGFKTLTGPLPIPDKETDYISE